jgi:pimeloyl-ACP methyl ester carboxylesterase
MGGGRSFAITQISRTGVTPLYGTRAYLRLTLCHVHVQADRIQQLYPEAERVRLQSGHCPHDDTPEEANEALLAWLGKVYRK